MDGQFRNGDVLFRVRCDEHARMARLRQGGSAGAHASFDAMNAAVSEQAHCSELLLLQTSDARGQDVGAATGEEEVGVGNPAQGRDRTAEGLLHEGMILVGHHRPRSLRWFHPDPQTPHPLDIFTCPSGGARIMFWVRWSLL